MARGTSPTERPREGNDRVGVGPGVAVPMRHGGTGGIGGFRMNPLAIQPAKIHCPPPRDDTLSRERLNSWLDRAASGRLGLIVAEAGFGKTTLLADWAMRTQRLTSWYRLEPDDRDWLTFVRHLVAGGRELDPEFAPETFRLLHALGPGGPTPADLAVSIAREMAEFGGASNHGLTLLLDDFHVVDGHTDTDPIVKALLDRTGSGFSIVISTRSTPRFSLGRLRARGGVMTIDGEAMCFDMDETGRLFREAYRRPLDEDLVSDLHQRTEGWPALLTLVRTGLEDRTAADPRALIETLQASRGDLYEFLAEEVMGSLPPDLAHFLTRVSVLMAVDLDTAVLVDERPADAIAASIRESERLGLLSRPDGESPTGFHHLVREFLVARLTAEIGNAEVRDLHRSIADRLRGVDWYAAAWHYLMASDADACASVVDSALDNIIASGLFEQVRPFLEPEAGDPERPVALILRSRVALSRGSLARAQALALDAVRSTEGTGHKGIALLNVISTRALFGIDIATVALAEAALKEDLTPTQRAVAQSVMTLAEVATTGDLELHCSELKARAIRQEHDGHRRYAGITRLNRAGCLVWLGDTEEALRDAGRAEALLGGIANPSFERVSATVMRAVCCAQLGRIVDARAIVAAASGDGSRLVQNELAAETSRLEVEYGSLDRARDAFGQLNDTGLLSGYRGLRYLVGGQIALREGSPDRAKELSTHLDADPCVDASGLLRTLLLRCRAAMALGTSDANELAHESQRVAAAQHSRPGIVVSGILVAIAEGHSIDEELSQTPPNEEFAWSLAAEEIAARLDDVSHGVRARVQAEAAKRSDRWRSALHMAIERGGRAGLIAAATLAEVGDLGDAHLLRTMAVSRKQYRPAALRVIQRIAPTVLVRDLGVVDVEVGGVPLARGMRRKVLALLCYLSSRAGMAANKDEALDALWPDLSPTAATNSLHQAIYFLRRIFEPDYREGLSAGYIQFDGDVVSLNSALIDSSSRRCWRALSHGDNGNPDMPTSLLSEYVGRYALDFAYEEWASDYRETLHAAVLAAVESAVRRLQDHHEFGAVIRLGQAILAIDPQADAVELELLTAYKPAVATPLRPSSTPTTRLSCGRSWESTRRRSGICEAAAIPMH